MGEQSTFEQRQGDIARLQNTCGRCALPIGNDWSDGWPLHGKIDLGFHSQAFAALRGKFIADQSDFEWWNRGHPAMKVNKAQHVVFQWDCKSPYRLCETCQRTLLTVIGRFFGIGELP